MKMFLTILFFLLNILTLSTLYGSSGKTIGDSEKIHQPTIEQTCKAFASIDYIEAQQFASKVQILIKNNDKKALSKLAIYPLRVYDGRIVGYRIDPYSKLKFPKLKKHISIIQTKRQFINKYDEIFIDPLKKEIIAADPHDIFCNWHGAMMADGSIWFYGKSPRFFEIDQPWIDQ